MIPNGPTSSSGPAIPTGRAFSSVAYGSAGDVLERSVAAKGLSPSARQDGGGQPAPGPMAVKSIRQSLICLNPEKTWKVGYDGNLEVYDLYFTFLHEIGHTIGLDHPGASGEVMGFRYDERVRDLQDGDIEAVRGSMASAGRPQDCPPPPPGDLRIAFPRHLPLGLEQDELALNCTGIPESAWI